MPATQRAQLLQCLPPRYARIIADHVTLHFGTDDLTPLPTATCGSIVGEADDSAGIQALIVAIDGTTHRSDGSHFHITWSLDENRSARESNDVLQAGWRPLAQAIAVSLIPARWNRA